MREEVPGPRNVRLPLRLERVLVRLIVTPRMHGIHHSDRLDETDSNWSSLLSAWDFLHRTMRLDVPRERIRDRGARLFTIRAR